MILLLKGTAGRTPHLKVIFYLSAQEQSFIANIIYWHMISFKADIPVSLSIS